MGEGGVCLKYKRQMNKRQLYLREDGAPLTLALFYETAVHSTDRVLYTLRDEDYAGFPSLKRLYMEMADPIEYDFALKYFYGWEQWEKITSTQWFSEYITQWRKELAIKLKSDALKRVMEEAQDKSRKNNYNANRFLIDKGWLDKETHKGPVGRPKKQEIKEAFHKEIQEDLARLGLDKLN